MQNNLANEKKSINKFQHRTSVNIITWKPDPVVCARRAKAELDAFSLLFSDEMVEKITFSNKIMEHNRNAKNLTDAARTEHANSCYSVVCTMTQNSQ